MATTDHATDPAESPPDDRPQYLPRNITPEHMQPPFADAGTAPEPMRTMAPEKIRLKLKFADWATI